MQLIKNSLLIILVSMNIFCFKTSEQESVKYQDRMNLITIFSFYLESVRKENEDKVACNQANAILPEFLGKCINGKVDTGLIFEATTDLAITQGTIFMGLSLVCKCSQTKLANGFSWERSGIREVTENGIKTNKIFNSYDVGKTNMDALVYKTNYNQSDNIYCLPGGCGFTEYKYQFLKVRIP